MVVVAFGLLPPFTVSASMVQDRSIKLENAQPEAVGLHKAGFRITNFSDQLGSIRIQYCADSPIIGSPCVPPEGFDASEVTIESQEGETGFSVHGDTDEHNIILTRSPVVPTEAELEYELDDIVNPEDLGTFYARIFTYPTDDGSGPYTQAGGIALSTAIDVEVETEVPPYLTFCASVNFTGLDCSTADGFFIDLGEFSENETTASTSEIIIATNAANGYTSRINGTTLTSGNNIIPPLPSPSFSQVGTSQFGVNLRNNSNPNIGANPVGPGAATPTANYNNVNQFMFNPNDAIASSQVPSDFRKFTISYVANVDSDQAPGFYSTTMSFVTLGNF